MLKPDSECWNARAVVGLAKFALLAACALLLCACNSTTVRTAGVEPVRAAAAPIPEHLLLDVGVDIFDLGLETLDRQDESSTPGVRRAESRFIPLTLAETLQNTGQWGAVRVVPARQSETDVYVTGRIIHSDGSKLELEVTVTDASGQTWFTRQYDEEISKYGYEPELRAAQDPFHGVYLAIARDMAEYMRRLDNSKLEALRATTKLRFAQRFAPDAFGDYVTRDSRGRYTITRLPAADDPLMRRVEAIRVRDQMFVDRLQDHYEAFRGSIQQPYDQWRSESHREAQELRRLRNEATGQKVLGALAVIGGILAQASGSSVARTAGVVGIGAGAYAFKSGLDKGSEARLRSLTLEELAQSLDAATAPQTLQLDNRTVTLTGTVEEQYAQWRSLLQEIYLNETGGTPAAIVAD